MTSSRDIQDRTLATHSPAAVCSIGPGDVMAGRYTVELLLGEGTYGWVFSAIDTASAPAQRVAVKVLRPECARVPAELRRFEERELALLFRLERAGPGRHVVRVLDPQLGVHRDLPFIVLELIDGPSLRDRINDGRPITKREAVRLGLGIARGLVALHAADIVHRDLKPANIRLRGGTEPVIVDLGIAIAATGTGTADLTAGGKAPMTPRYAAPEQLAGERAEAPCDVYALGVILEELAAGSTLDGIARRCLDRDPLSRPRAIAISAELLSLRRNDRSGRRGVALTRAARTFVLGAAIAIMASIQPASNVEASSWKPIAPMRTCRGEHTATRLMNGDVLIVGGYDLSARSFVERTERYDPTRDRWTASGAVEPRKMHTATLLPSGEVLVAGGIGPEGWLADAMRYAPATETWTHAASMGAPRARFTATWLPGANRVLVVGGSDARGAPQASVERYDPEANRWTTAAPMSVARVAHAALWIPSLERTLVLGGGGPAGFAQASVELYDPTIDGWTFAAPMSVGREYFSATLLADGRVLIVGGSRDGTPLASAEIYEPTANRWMDAAPMRSSRYQHTATRLGDGKVLIAGGVSRADAEIYDPVSNHWSPVPSDGPQSRPIAKHTMTLLADGRLLSAGSSGADGCACSTFGPGSPAAPPIARWTPAPPMSTGRDRHTMTVLPDGRVLIVGVPYSTSINMAEIYDPRVNSYEHSIQTTASPPGRFAPTATLIPSRAEVLFTGGGHADGNHSSTERYALAQNIFMPARPMSTYRREHTATLLPSGEVLIIGGYGAGFHATTERYDPARDVWTTTAPMHVPRTQHASVVLDDGRVLVVGGTAGGKRLLASSELYTPATDTWTSTAPLNAARSRGTALLLHDGRVLLAGGYGDAYREIGAEIYDANLDRWEPTASMRTPRINPAAVLLADGEVLIAGGRQGRRTCLDSVEIYDTTRDTWSNGPSMGTARCETTAALLTDGRVLVTGGLGGVGEQVLTSAEITSAE